MKVFGWVYATSDLRDGRRRWQLGIIYAQPEQHYTIRSPLRTGLKVLQQIPAEFSVAPLPAPRYKSPRTDASLSPNQFTNRRSQRMQSATTWGDAFSLKMFEKIAQSSHTQECNESQVSRH